MTEELGAKILLAAQRIAGKFCRAVSSGAYFDDLVDSALIQALEAEKRFKPGGRSLFNYLQERMKGAIKDHLRQIDTQNGIPRSIRKKAKIAGEQIIRRVSLNTTNKKVRKAISQPSMITGLCAKVDVEKLLGDLTPTQAKNLEHRFLLEETIPEAAKSLGVSEPTVVEKQRIALGNARKLLEPKPILREENYLKFPLRKRHRGEHGKLPPGLSRRKRTEHEKLDRDNSVGGVGVSELVCN